MNQTQSEMLPGVRLTHNLELIAHHTFDGAPNVGEGFAMKVTSDGRRYLYVAHESPPIAMSILDVTDPRAPQLIEQLPCEHDEVRGNSLAMSGDTLLLAKQVTSPGMSPAGFDIFDISEPTKPEKVGFFDASGPHSVGTHFVSTMDGRFAHISTGAADFEPKDPRDHQFYIIAWAVVEALQERSGAKVLFATHFHELTHLADRLPGVHNFHVAVREWNEEIIFLHKVRPGGTDRSYGIQVARLAGLPEPVIARARTLLGELEAAGQRSVDAGEATQLGLFAPPRDPTLDELARLDLAHLTPIEALNLLAKWQGLVNAAEGPRAGRGPVA